MSHFALIDDNNIVQNIIVAEQSFIDSWLLGEPSKWIQTSYNTRQGIHYMSDSDTPSNDQSKALRKNYAQIGYIYDPIRDAFIPPKIFESWVLDEFSCTWVAPITKPNDGKYYRWNENIKNWEEYFITQI